MCSIFRSQQRNAEPFYIDYDPQCVLVVLYDKLLIMNEMFKAVGMTACSVELAAVIVSFPCDYWDRYRVTRMADTFFASHSITPYHYTSSRWFVLNDHRKEITMSLLRLLLVASPAFDDIMLSCSKRSFVHGRAKDVGRCALLCQRLIHVLYSPSFSTLPLASLGMWLMQTKHIIDLVEYISPPAHLALSDAFYVAIASFELKQTPPSKIAGQFQTNNSSGDQCTVMEKTPPPVEEPKK